MNDAQLLASATEFVVDWCGERIHISRYDNHGRLLAGGRWSVGSWKSGGPGYGSTNVFYLNVDQVWRYKAGSTWETAREALDFLERWACRPGSNGWKQIAENKTEVAA